MNQPNVARLKLRMIPFLDKEEDLVVHRKVSLLELIFDLFFVVVIASLAHNLAADLLSMA